ncbi:hypothetical protein VTO42DRAFT_3050 [Malbranchea cinnamomea]
MPSPQLGGWWRLQRPPSGMETRHNRLQYARQAGPPAEIIFPEKAGGPCAEFYQAGESGRSIFYLWYLQPVRSLELQSPIIPVAHPYTYTPERPPRQGLPYPFVRWPERHVYARDHGDRDGLGSYNHVPARVTYPFDSAVRPMGCRISMPSSPKPHAHASQNGSDFLTQEGTTLLEEASRKVKSFNGIFSVTPDNLPFAGKAKATQNLWLCAAVWVTHAAGTAKLLCAGNRAGSETFGGS